LRRSDRLFKTNEPGPKLIRPVRGRKENVTYRFDKLFAPRSVAVVGASPRETSPGRAVLKNLRRGGFVGEIYLVNPHYDSIEGVAAVKSCEALPDAPDVVVIGVPPRDVPSVVSAAAARPPGSF
jgi:acetyltransferase